MILTPDQVQKVLASMTSQRDVVGKAHMALQSFDLSALPAAFATQFTALKAQVDAHLATLPPTDMVEQARQASWTFESMFEAMSRLTDICGQLGTAFNGMSAAHQSASDAKVATLIDGKVSAGELVPKDKFELALQSARAEGVTDGLARAAKHEARKEQLKTAGLTAPDAVLALDDAGFALALQGATDLKAAADALKLTEAPMEFGWDFFADEPGRKMQLAVHTAAHAAAVKAIEGARLAKHSAPAPAPAPGKLRADPLGGGSAPDTSADDLPKAA